MNSLKNNVVAISGAGSGLGRALAIQCAEQGAQLSLSDVNEVGLLETRKICENVSTQLPMKAYPVDVSDKQQVKEWALATQADFGAVHLLINNAGVSLNASVEHTSYDNFEWLMGVNFWGSVYGAKEFLPILKQSGDGHILFVSSCFGIVAGPDQSAYSCSKFAIRSFAESLAMEMKAEGSNVAVTCALPGGLKTEFMENARFGQRVSYLKDDEALKKDFTNALASTSAEQAAKKMIKGVLNNKPRVVIGPDSRVFDLAQRLAPAHYGAFFTRVVDRLTGQSSKKAGVKNESIRLSDTD